MNRPLGTASSNPCYGTPETPLDAPQEATGDGEAAPNDRPTGMADCAHEDQNPGRPRHVVGSLGRRVDDADPRLLTTEFSSRLLAEFGPSQVQLALAHAHVAWAKRNAPHLLEEWLDD